MSTNDKHKILNNIELPKFYQFAVDVVSDLGYSLYRTVKEIEEKRRIELWKYAGGDRAMVWIEIVPSGKELEPYLSADVLRAMNDENVTALFFFTNSTMTLGDREILEGHNRLIFGKEEIIERLESIDEKKTVKVVKKRREVKTPSGSVLIKNFLKHRDTNRKNVRLKMSATPDLACQYTRLVRRVLEVVDSVQDINNIPSGTRELLKKIQFDLLPELPKTSSYIFPLHFAPLRNILFKLVQHAVIYIGNFTEYESESSLKNNRQIIEDLLKQVDNVDEDVLNYKSRLLQQAEKNSLQIIITSGVVCLASIILLVMVKLS